jgi:hypothetical protein
VHFLKGSCNYKFGAGVVKCPRTPHRKTFETVRTIMRETGPFPGTNVEREQQRRAEGDVLAAMQGSPSTTIRIISGTTGVAQTSHHYGL